eukprot:TRINITY_DN497_c0_g2_i1.p1 TRINITY_DN497_c0_g2~~TRINITY_DN497_c0_g2_i1.p1  ORF type:complete len:451 (-),score=18.68 TRINITY_DN497_c0_g2_i1:92-1444(-)
MREVKIDLTGKCCRKMLRFKVSPSFKLTAFVTFIAQFVIEILAISYTFAAGGPLGKDNITLGIFCLCVELALIAVSIVMIASFKKCAVFEWCKPIFSPDYIKGFKRLQESFVIAVPTYLSLFLRIIYLSVNWENIYAIILFISVVIKIVGCFRYTILPTLKLINYIVIYIFIKDSAWAFASTAVLQLYFNPHRSATNVSCYFCHSTIPGTTLCFSKKRAFHLKCVQRYFSHKQNIREVLYFMGISMRTTSEDTIKIYAEHVVAKLTIKARIGFTPISEKLLHFNRNNQLEIVDTTTNKSTVDIRNSKTLVSHLLSPNVQYVPSYNLMIKDVVYYSQGNNKELSKYDQNQQKSYKVPLKSPVFVMDDRYFIKVQKEGIVTTLKIFDIYDEENGVESVEVPREYRNEIFTTEKLQIVKPGLVKVGEGLVVDINEKRIREHTLQEYMDIIIVA